MPNNLNYVQHIFPGWQKILLGMLHPLHPPSYGSGWWHPRGIDFRAEGCSSWQKAKHAVSRLEVSGREPTRSVW